MTATGSRRSVRVEHVTDPAASADVRRAYDLILRAAYRGVSGATDIALASRPITSTVVAPSVVSPGVTPTGRPAPRHPSA